MAQAQTLTDISNVSGASAKTRRPVAILSHGQGQDSATILALLTDPNRPEIRERYIGDRDLIVIHACTGNEHDETIAYREWTRAYCESVGVLYVQIDGAMGFHSGSWSGGLVAQWRAHNTIGSASYPKSCTDALKTSVIYKFLNHYFGEIYGYPTGQKKALYSYVEEFGEQIRMMIGIAKGEESRVNAPTVDQIMFNIIEEYGVDGKKPKSGDHVWMTKNVNRIYPLIDLGFDRAACQEYLASRGMPIPRPSNCKFCPYKSKIEVLEMIRFFPNDFAMWAELEDAKLKHWAGRVNPKTGEIVPNHGVKGTKTLREFAAEAEKEFGHYSDAQVREYIMSHGHCVKSKY